VDAGGPPTGAADAATGASAAQAQTLFREAFELHRKGLLARAGALYEDILKAHPRHADCLHFLGVLSIQTRQCEKAVEWIDRAIAIAPDNPAVHCNRGIALKELGQFEAAIASYDRAIALKPDFAKAYYNRGVALKELKRLDAAVRSYEEAAALDPDFAEAHYNLGVVLQELRRFDAACASYRRAIAGKPDFADAFSNLGAALEELNQLDAAIVSYDRAIALRADLADAHSNRGNALLKLHRVDAAIASYDRAIEIEPDLADAHYNKSLALLLTGDFAAGWALYEWRWKRSTAISTRRVFQQPLWLGKESLTGMTILLYFEQGIGDTIQFCRYAKLVSALGARVIMEVPGPLINLLEGLPGVSVLVAAGRALPEYDYQCPLMSLPLACGTTLRTIPVEIPYLVADRGKAAAWRERLGEKKRVRVGLVWSGGFRQNQPQSWSVNGRRNIPLPLLAELDGADVEFFSLQKGEGAERQLREVQASGWNGPRIIDYTSEFNDFADTAAFVENLDLVISVDTSTAHLAAAMGKPTWILNRYDTCWRWGLDRSDSPWYPTVTLFRQSAFNDWTGVVSRVREQLGEFGKSGDN